MSKTLGQMKYETECADKRELVEVAQSPNALAEWKNLTESVKHSFERRAIEDFGK